MARSKPCESLIYHLMSPRDIPRNLVHGSGGRLKVWLITFNFDRFRAPQGLVIVLTKNLHMGCGTTYNASRVIRTIWIAPECHQTTHLLFCHATKERPRNSRKSFSYVRSISWESLIYHLIATRGIPRHSVYGSRGRLEAWLITFNFDRFRAVLGPVIFFAKKSSYGVRHDL